MKNRIIKIFQSSTDLFQAAAEDFSRRAILAVVNNNVFSVVLSGGNTVKFFFDALTENELYQQRIPWQQIKFFFGDERYVPADNVESNYFTAKEYLFSKVGIPPENIYRIPTEINDAKKTAENYETLLRKTFNLKQNEFPIFDLIYLGLGEDAHTASLMPFSDVLNTHSENLVASLWVPKLKMHRITLTPPAINHAKCVCFLVTGANKALAVKQTLEGTLNPQQYPAQLIQGTDENIWYLDQAAAELCQDST